MIKPLRTPLNDTLAKSLFVVRSREIVANLTKSVIALNTTLDRPSLRTSGFFDVLSETERKLEELQTEIRKMMSNNGKS